MFKCDYHTHTHFSFDGAKNGSVDALCQAAIAHGVTDLALTDHFECNARAEAFYPPYKAEEAYARIMEAKETYRGRLHVTYGIELGQANQYPEEARALLSSYPFEFVIGSIHNLTGAPDFYYFDFQKLMQGAGEPYIGHFLARYLEELNAMVEQFPQISTVGHLTYIQRYCALAGHRYDLSRHLDQIAAFYRKLISREIALEVNVSTLWKGLGFSMPDANLLSLYRACGGRLITVGTDSHSPEHIGECVEEGFRIAKHAGLDHVLVVRDGKKEVIKL